MVAIARPPLGTDVVASYTYNEDGNLETAIENGVLTTFTWNLDGTLATSQQAGRPLRTYVYEDDNLVEIE